MQEELTKEELQQQVDQLEKEDATRPGIKTETTSIREEEKKTPELVPPMSEQQYVERAMQDYISGAHQIELMLRSMSKRAVCRAFLAVLKLPEEGQKIHLQSKEEQMVFGIGQRVIMARTTLMINHMKEEVNKDRQEKLVELAKKEEINNVKPEDSTTQTISDNKEIENGNNGN